MAWLRIDDGFATHPKILALGSSDHRWTWLQILTYTCRYRSPVVPADIGEVIQKAGNGFVNRCIEVGLIDVLEDGTMHVHDWEHYQAGDPLKAARQRRFRQKVDARVDATVDAGVDGDVDASVDASRAGARAFPSRPVLIPPNPHKVGEPEQGTPRQRGTNPRATSRRAKVRAAAAAFADRARSDYDPTTLRVELEQRYPTLTDHDLAELTEPTA
jgi:hypothetical protein